MWARGEQGRGDHHDLVDSSLAVCQYIARPGNVMRYLVCRALQLPSSAWSLLMLARSSSSPTIWASRVDVAEGVH